MLMQAIAEVNPPKRLILEMNSSRAKIKQTPNTVRQYAMLTRLSKLGEDQKLDQKQPYIDILRAGRMQVMAQAAISEQYGQTIVLPNEQEDYSIVESEGRTRGA